MTTLTKQQARELGMVAFTNVYRPSEFDLMARMFKDISANHPGAVIVQREYGMKQIWTPARKKHVNLNSNPKAMRGNYQTVREIVGQAI